MPFTIFFSLIDEPEEVTNEQALKLITEIDSTVYEPGTEWGYTNSGYLLLSLLVERISEKNYNEYLSEEVLRSLGIKDAQLHPNRIDALEGFENDQPSKMFSLTTGDAGIFLTSQDLIRFFENQENMSDYIMKAEHWSSPWHDEQWRYGFGWFFSEDGLGEFRAHSGKSGGFESYIRISQENDLMFFILSNNVNGSAKLLRGRITEELIKTVNKK